MKRLLSIGIILLFIGMSISSSTGLNVVEQSIKPLNGKTLYVGGSGPNNYTKIQDAIDNASDGDTVYVYNGIYNESVNVDKSISMIGQDKNTTIIDGQNKKARVVKLKVDSINICNFSIINSRDNANDGGLYVHSSNNVIENTIIMDNKGGEAGIVVIGKYNEIRNNIIKNNRNEGMFISYKSHFNIIEGNTINENGRGIWEVGKNNEIFGNQITNNTREGIMIRGGKNYCKIRNNLIANNRGAAIKIEWDASHIFISKNNIKNNDKGLIINDACFVTAENNSFLDYGIKLGGGKSQHWDTHTIKDNTISGRSIYFLKSAYGSIVPSDVGQVILADCINCQVKNINISNVYIGIQVGFSRDNILSYSTIHNNVAVGINLRSSSNNIIHNNTIENISQSGIEISGNSQDNKIEGNTIEDNQKAIYIRGNSGSTTIRFNTIENNDAYGIYLNGSDNTVYKNTFKTNQVGIYLDFSYDNIITHNNFIKSKKAHAKFIVTYKKPRDNKWQNNYYDNTFGLLPRIIKGIVKTRFSFSIYPGTVIYVPRPGINVDWNPAFRPYDIEV